MGNIGTVIVSAYKTGWFPEAKNGGIPDWHVDDKTDISANFYKWTNKDKDKIKNNSVTVFILPDKITGLQMWDDHNPGNWIEASTEISNRIKDLKFEAGKEYNLKISSTGVQKNTKSRSIAMSVRCVSE